MKSIRKSSELLLIYLPLGLATMAGILIIGALYYFNVERHEMRPACDDGCFPTQGRLAQAECFCDSQRNEP